MNNTTSTKKAAITTTITEEGTLVIEFGNGKALTVEIGNLSPEIVRQATLHGLKQKLVDAAAIARNTTTGLSASLNDKYEAVKEVFDRITDIEAPSWNKVRESGTGSGGGNGGVLVRALMQLTGKDKEAISAFLEEKTKAEKAALRANPKVAAIIAELQREKSAEIDTDELLGELSE